MGDRGRKPASALNVVESGIVSLKRPEPPDGFSAVEKKAWREVVDRLPADWFPEETLGLLRMYCKHAAAADRVTLLVAEMEARPVADGPVDKGSTEYFNLEDYDRLLKMQERESRAMTALARSMRITQQATYDPKRKKGPVTAKPWEQAQ